MKLTILDTSYTRHGAIVVFLCLVYFTLFLFSGELSGLLPSLPGPCSLGWEGRHGFIGEFRPGQIYIVLSLNFLFQRFYLFLERGEGRENKRERNIDM